jgi:F-type H+-transporting ATPase subunit gamma
MKDKSTPIITVGERGRNYFTRRGFNTIAEFIEVGDNPSNKDVEEIVNATIKAFKEGEARNVYMVYTKFTSPMRQEAKVLMVLPLKGEEGAEGHEIEFDPSAGEVFEYVLPLYLRALVYFALTNGIASEYAIRIRSTTGPTICTILPFGILHYSSSLSQCFCAAYYFRNLLGNTALARLVIHYLKFV